MDNGRDSDADIETVSISLGRYILLAACSVVALLLPWKLYLDHYKKTLALLPGGAQTIEQAGQFGDSFGSVNVFISAMTIGLIVLTMAFQLTQMAMQRNELKLQRRELALQREESKASREALQDQARHASFQVKVAIAQIKANAYSTKVRLLELRLADSLIPERRKEIQDDMNATVVAIGALAEMLEHDLEPTPEE